MCVFFPAEPLTHLKPANKQFYLPNKLNKTSRLKYIGLKNVMVATQTAAETFATKKNCSKTKRYKAAQV